MLGDIVSDARLLKFVLRLHQTLEACQLRTMEWLLMAVTIGVDKKNRWIHVYTSGDITLKCLLENGTEIYARAYCRIPDYLQTMAIKG